MILRIKITGIDDKKAIEFLEKSLKCRLNEEEMLFLDKSRICKKVIYEKSEDSKNGEKDIMKFVIRTSSKLFCNFDEFE